MFQIKSSHLWPFIPHSCLLFVVLLFSSANYTPCGALDILIALNASRSKNKHFVKELTTWCPFSARHFLLFYSRRVHVSWPIKRMHLSKVQLKVMLLYSRLVELFYHRLPSHPPADCLGIRLFVFNWLSHSLWRIFYPHLSRRDFSFKYVSNKIVTFIAIYLEQLFIVRCPTCGALDILIALNASQ